MVVPADPWIAQNLAPCTFTQGQKSANLGYFEYAFDITAAGSSGLPFSMAGLDDHSRHVLAAQLQNALNQLQQPAPASAFNPATSATNIARNGRTYVGLTGAPKADLVAAGFSGPGALAAGDAANYTATIRNDGADVNGQVEFTISMLAPLSNIDLLPVQAPGFNCTSSSAMIDCRGGTLAQGQSATMSFSAYANAAGSGKLLLNVNPNNTVAESNTANNSAVLTVAIN